MSYTYTSWTTALFNTVVAQSSDPNWTNQIPTFIDYAEQRMYRELDILATRVLDTSLTLSSGTNTYTLPSHFGTFIVVENMWILSSDPGGSINLTQNLLTPVSMPFLSVAYPNEISSNCAIPEFMAWTGAGTGPGSGVQPVFQLGPCPDLPYALMVQGTVRPTPLSSANATTLLTTYYPDLWFSCTMVAASAFMRNFGSQADNPAMAVSWEAQYQTLFKSADIEEARKQFRSQAWATEQPRSVTVPPRT